MGKAAYIACGALSVWFLKFTMLFCETIFVVGTPCHIYINIYIYIYIYIIYNAGGMGKAAYIACGADQIDV